jgi:hypothetical protein
MRTASLAACAYRDKRMDQLLGALPKTFIAVVVMVLALLVFRQIQPPKTICDAQLERFHESQQKFLFDRIRVGETVLPSLAKKMFDDCSDNNSPGGCFEYFEMLKKMLIDLSNIPEQCAEPTGEVTEVSTWVWKSMKLMVQMAWGEKAPASYLQRNGWFDSSELTLFCSLRKQSIRIYGNEKFAEWQEGMLKSMPQAETLTREQVWPRSILSTSCDVYR